MNSWKNVDERQTNAIGRGAACINEDRDDIGDTEDGRGAFVRNGGERIASGRWETKGDESGGVARGHDR